MKSTIDYLNEAIQKLALKNDYQLAKHLGHSTGVMSNFRLKRRVIDNYTALKLASILGIDAIKIIATAESEREKDEARKTEWLRLASTDGDKLPRGNPALQSTHYAQPGTCRRSQQLHWRKLPIFDRRKAA